MASPAWSHEMLASALRGGQGLLSAGKTAVAYASRHTGVPAVVVAAGALVVSYRIFRRAVRLAVELAIALTVVLVATKMGWIHF